MTIPGGGACGTGRLWMNLALWITAVAIPLRG